MEEMFKLNEEYKLGHNVTNEVFVTLMDELVENKRMEIESMRYTNNEEKGSYSKIYELLHNYDLITKCANKRTKFTSISVTDEIINILEIIGFDYPRKHYTLSTILDNGTRFILVDIINDETEEISELQSYDIKYNNNAYRIIILPYRKMIDSDDEISRFKDVFDTINIIAMSHYKVYNTGTETLDINNLIASASPFVITAMCIFEEMTNISERTIQEMKDIMYIKWKMELHKYLYNSIFKGVSLDKIYYNLIDDIESVIESGINPYETIEFLLDRMGLIKVMKELANK